MAMPLDTSPIPAPPAGFKEPALPFGEDCHIAYRDAEQAYYCPHCGEWHLGMVHMHHEDQCNPNATRTGWAYTCAVCRQEIGFAAGLPHREGTP